MPQYSKVLRTKIDCFMEIILFSFCAIKKDGT